MKQLIIAEKPSLARKIVSAIGNMERRGDYYENDKYIVISVFGHLLTLYDLEDYLGKDNNRWELTDLNFFPEKFKYKVKGDNGIKERYELIKKLMSRKDVDTIVNSGDADREGEVLVNIIIYKILNELRIRKNITRIWLGEQTEETIRKELRNPRPIKNTENLYNEGRARMYADWLYGIYLTRYVSIKAGAKLPTGRVIVPTVRFIYDRYIEQINFVPEKYYKITCPVRLPNGTEIDIDFKDMKYPIDKKGDADRLVYELQNNPIIVTKVEQKDITKQPQRLFSLSTLQNYMNKYYKWGLKKTLSVAQMLYEKAYTTYPRTNTEYLAEQERNKFNAIINKIYDSNLFIRYKELCDNISLSTHDRSFDSSKVESHSAITITTKIPHNFEEFSEDEKLLYQIIFNRCLANFCDEKCIIAETKVTFSFNGYDNVYTTTITGQVVKQRGYLLFENNIKDKIIPCFLEDNQFICKPSLSIKTTKAPANVSPEELNKFYEKPFKKETIEEENTDEDYKNILNGLQIGTDATRADTLEKCIEVGYLQSKNNALLITDKGIAFINILFKLNINLWAEKSAMLSQYLKKVNHNIVDINTVVDIVKNDIRKIISQETDVSNEITNAKEVIGYCPFCNKPVYENKKAYSCSGYKEGCKFVIWKTFFGKNITKNDAKDLLNPDKKYTTKKKKGFVNKDNKMFDAKLYLTESGKIAFKFN